MSFGRICCVLMRMRYGLDLDRRSTKRLRWPGLDDATPTMQPQGYNPKDTINTAYLHAEESMLQIRGPASLPSAPNPSQSLHFLAALPPILQRLLGGTASSDGWLICHAATGLHISSANLLDPAPDVRLVMMFGNGCPLIGRRAAPDDRRWPCQRKSACMYINAHKRTYRSLSATS